MDTSKTISAFPVFDSNRAGMDYECMDPGMTLRDYFAAQVLPAIYKDFWESYREGEHDPDENWQKYIAKSAYQLADAMMKERGE